MITIPLASPLTRITDLLGLPRTLSIMERKSKKKLDGWIMVLGCMIQLLEGGVRWILFLECI